ncbi:MAG: adenylate/guanylate cyclase domain-containing protein [Alphaproteobacteria bacterium]
MSAPEDATKETTAPAADSLREIIAENQRVIDRLNARLARKDHEIRIIQQIAAEVNSSLDLDHILGLILRALDSVLEFHHCLILLADESGETLKVAASRGYGESGIGAVVRLGEGTIGVAARRRRVLRVGNLAFQLGYMKAIREAVESAGGTVGDGSALPGLPDAQSQMAIPLIVKDRLIGVLAVESPRPNEFNALDEMLLSIVANQVAAALDNAHLHQAETERAKALDAANRELSTLNETLEARVQERTEAVSRALADAERQRNLRENLLQRMAPPEVIPLMLEERLVAKKLIATTMFTDLVEFTRFSAGMEPDEIFSHLNHFFGVAGDVIGRYRGHVNKTNGDGLMALFGVPNEVRTNATDAVVAALDLQAELDRRFPLAMRVGIGTGAITAGLLGPRNKSLYDVLGEAVNLASRMEEVCPPGGIAIGAATHERIRPYFAIESLGEREIKGLGMQPCYLVKGLRPIAEDERRIDPTSAMAALIAPLVAEVEAIKAARFDMINFRSIQARDAAFNHNEAVAALALGLLRRLKASGDAEAAALDEAGVVHLGLVHDIGKRRIGSARLNDPVPSATEQAALHCEMHAATIDALARIGAPELGDAVSRLYAFERDRGADGEADQLTEIVAAADIYDSLTAPKLYKGASWRIQGALEELLRMPYCLRQVRPVFLAFAELMRPKGASLAIGSARRVVID